MIIIPGLSRPLEAVGKHIVSWNDSDGHLSVDVGGYVRRPSCPRCGWASSRMHSRYQRRLADAPSFGRPVTLNVEMRRFKCINGECAQQTFSERLDAVAGVGQRRTLRLREEQRALGYALGGAAAARLAARLGMRTSRHTVLRELRSAGCPGPACAPVVVGIDDWAIARGHRYGTLIIDLERRCPIELMDGRDTTAVLPWLRMQPTIEVIARDRASAYADAGRTALPGAQQIADRWHLMVNLYEAIERLLLRHAKHMREAAHQVGETMRLERPESDNDAQRSPRLRVWQRQGIERREARLARYEEAVRRRAQGASIKAIARAMKLDYRTVRKFVRAGSFPERAKRSNGPALSDAQRGYVAARAAEGCLNTTQLWKELRFKGFTGRRSVVHDALARACAADARGRRVVAAAAATMGMPSTRRACAWILGCKDLESDGQQSGPRRQFVRTLCSIEPSIAEARGLAQRFLGFIHRRDLAGFDQWLRQARCCEVPELRRLVARFDADLPAVRAAFSSHWSNGQTEGHVNRLKYLKRQMYGRAKLDLLRIRVLHPN